MAIRIHESKDGAKTYQARYRNEYNRPQTKTFKTKRQAEQFLATVTADKARGEFHDPNRGKVRFNTVAEQWLATTVDVKPKTRSGYEWLLRKYVLPTFGDRPIGNISPTDVDRFVGAIRNSKGEPLAAHTVRRVVRVLKMVLTHAVRTRALKVNPADNVRLPRVVSREMVFLSADEVEAVCAYLRSPHDVLVRFAAYTGLRAGEIAGLRWRDIDLGSGRVTVARNVVDIGGHLVVGEPKNGKTRTFSLPSFLIEDMRCLPGSHSPDAPVFADTRGGLLRHAQFYRRYFKPAVRAALPVEKHGLRFHDMRHTCAALLIGLGAHPKEIAERLGHSTISITMDTYGHIFPGRDSALAAALDGVLRAARPPGAAGAVASPGSTAP